MTNSVRTRPFLKWAGGKYRLLDKLLLNLPKSQRLVEPFLGAGALFLNTDYDEYLLADINPDLIGVYRQLQHNSSAFIEASAELFHTDHNQQYRYLELRDEFNQCHDDAFRRSCLFLYLNRHGYNGLCRYNQRGGFNVPFGRYKRPYFPLRELRHAAERCQRAQIQCADFEQIFLQVRTGDVVYCDPPYAPLTATSNFTQYHQREFGPREQQRLAIASRRLAHQGIPVLLSNHATPFTEQVYDGALLQRFPVQRNISCHQRLPAEELLAYYPPA